MWRNLLAIVVVISASPLALADLPLPKDLKYVDPRVRFNGVEDYSGHVFYLRFLSFAGGPADVPYTLREVKDAKPFNLKAQRRLINMTLLAMEKSEFDKRAKDDPSLKWLTDKTDGVARASINPPSTVGKVSDKEVPIMTYRVTLKDGKLSAEMVKDQKRSEAAPEGPLPMWAFAIVFAFSLAGLGIWFARRRS